MLERRRPSRALGKGDPDVIGKRSAAVEGMLGTDGRVQEEEEK